MRTRIATQREVLPPLTVCQRCGGKSCNTSLTARAGSLDGMFPGPTARLLRGIVECHLQTEDLLNAHNAQCPGQAPLRQRLAEVFSNAVPGVGQHDSEGHAGFTYSIEFFQSNLTFGLVLLAFHRNASVNTSF